MTLTVSNWTIAREPRTFSVLFAWFCRLILSYIAARQKYMTMYHQEPAYPSRPSSAPPSRRRKRRPASLPPSVEAPSYDATSSRTAWASSQYIKGLAVGPSYQQRAYDAVRRQVFVPQTTRPTRSKSNEGNLVPPPSYRGTLLRMEGAGVKRQDPYYYASRDYLARTGSYYGTYSRPKYYQRPHDSNVSTFYRGPSYDVYSPSYGVGYGGTTVHQRRPMSQYQKPVIVESHDDLGRVSHFLV